MKKIILLPPILLLFVLMAFFSCTKDTQTPVVDNTKQKGQILSMAKDKDGILNIKVSVNPSASNAVTDRDGECTIYEALRFKAWDCSNNPPEESDDCVTVEFVKFRLIIISKTTHARTPVSSWMTADDVGGLNISWYDLTPLSDYWYATEIEDCGEAIDYPTGFSTCAEFFICDFWSDDYMVQLDPWNCGNGTSIPAIPPYADAADFDWGPLEDDDKVIVVCTLGEECVVTGEDAKPYFCL